MRGSPEPSPKSSSLVDSAPPTPAAFHILLALISGASHGYGIMQEVERLTEGRVKLGHATLYRSIQKLAVDGMIEELSDPSAAADERRREYRLTALGRRIAGAEAERLRVLVQVSRRLGLLAEAIPPAPQLTPHPRTEAQAKGGHR